VFHWLPAGGRVGLGQTDQIVAVLSDANVARKRELEGPGQSSPGNAAMTGFGMVSHSAMALSKDPPW